ncbi:scavenger receptor class B member 1-like [Choristoneura fumiferana]|uniref:scavenger receptor class B member 1-like n=1 Tax=Choristoneura fumiferana TaxID=7141 RepID=UPI003D156583
MDHLTLEKMSSTAPMLEKPEERVVINGAKILIREDTILAGLQGCAGCGRAQFTCAGVTKQWSSLCWGKQSEKKYYCLLVSLSATFVLSLIGTVFFCFTNTVNNAILSNMVIRNNSMAYSLWRKPTVEPLMKVHLFNYTNWQRVRDGLDDKFHVEDVGPFVYSQQVERVNVKFEGDQLSYQERNTFRYRPDKTEAVQFEKIFVPNLPLMGVVAKAIDINLNSISQFTLNQALNWANHPEAFLELPVHRFLWGYDDSIINSAKPILSIQGQLKFEKFGLLVTKNGTVDEHFTINTGEHDKKKMNIIEKVDGKDHLSFWGNPECNSLEASDGSIFPPSLLDRQSTLHVFFPNLCRRLPFKYEKDVETADGIQLLRYRMPIDVFDDPSHNPDNQCYCEIDSGTCPPRGVINVTACAMGAPALASHPHFLRGDPRLREEITGLNPDPILHDSYVDIHPTLGISLGGKSSLQINIEIKKTAMFSALTYLKQGLILPVAWIDMTLDELPEDVRSLVYHGTFSTAAAQLTLTIFCIAALTVSTICLIILLVQRRQRPCVTIKKVVLDTELKNTVS